jgi:hypothetical protein
MGELMGELLGELIPQLLGECFTHPSGGLRYSTPSFRFCNQ